MWCGPDAVARLTEWDRHQAWLHIRYLREKAGARRMTDKPRGGTYTIEILKCFERAGFSAARVPIPEGCRTLRKFWAYYKNEFRGGVFIEVRGHFIALRPSDPLPLYYAHRPIVQAYWITEKKLENAA